MFGIAIEFRMVARAGLPRIDDLWRANEELRQARDQRQSAVAVRARLLRARLQFGEDWPILQEIKPAERPDVREKLAQYL